MAEEGPERRKTGRPRRYGPGRVNATVRFTPERYAELKAAAEQSGRSISEEVEVRVERALQYDQMLASMRTTLAEMEQGNVDATLRRLGYAMVRSDTGHKAWFEPGYPGTEPGTERLRSGFPPPEEGQ